MFLVDLRAPRLEFLDKCHRLLGSCIAFKTIKRYMRRGSLLFAFCIVPLKKVFDPSGAVDFAQTRETFVRGVGPFALRAVLLNRGGTDADSSSRFSRKPKAAEEAAFVTCVGFYSWRVCSESKILQPARAADKQVRELGCQCHAARAPRDCLGIEWASGLDGEAKGAVPLHAVAPKPVHGRGLKEKQRRPIQEKPAFDSGGRRGRAKSHRHPKVSRRLGLVAATRGCAVAGNTRDESSDAHPRRRML
mmetsp:Transcript_23372/g.47823  ORF Transcript_23372/g.47823 Transcript_23372/m.47823 type:complete len:247 (+) Transcript_23372:354-1094(+)